MRRFVLGVALLAMAAPAFGQTPRVRPLGNHMIGCEASYTPVAGVHGKFRGRYDAPDGKIGVYATNLWFDGVDTRTVRKVPWGISGVEEVDTRSPVAVFAGSRALRIDVAGRPGVVANGGYLSQSSARDLTLRDHAYVRNYLSLAVNIPGARPADVQAGQFRIVIQVQSSPSASSYREVYAKTLDEWDAKISGNGDVRISAFTLGDPKTETWLGQQIFVSLFYRGERHLVQTYNPHKLTAEASRLKYESQILGQAYIPGALPYLCKLEPIVD